MFGCESWTIKKAEHRRIDTFELWCWRRLLRVSWTARRSNQSILKEIIPEYSLEGLMLKLKLQYFGHLMQRTDSLEKTLMLGKTEGDDRGWDGWMASSTQRTWVWVNSSSWWWKPGMLQSMVLQRVRHDWATKLSWTELMTTKNSDTRERLGAQWPLFSVASCSQSFSDPLHPFFSSSFLSPRMENFDHLSSIAYKGNNLS